MNIKKSLENRIRGWLPKIPKEPFRVSFQADAVYSERILVGKFVKAVVGSISVLAIIVLALAIRFSFSIHNPLFAVVVSLPLIFTTLMLLNYRGISIRITSNKLIIDYGILNRKRILLSEILSCERTTANFRKYLGVGLRFGTDGSSAYSTSLGNAVKINLLKGRPFVFSSNNPDEICSIISRMKHQTKV
jgi:uncharacterized membrane protein YdbT with pleckstrin-like domain